MALLSAIIPASPGTYIRTSFTATGGQTSFSATYSPGFVEVFLNGVLLNSSDYTASNGTTVVLSAGATAGDIVETIAYRVTDITTASTAVTATNLSGGAASRIPYQSGIGATAFIANGNSGEALISAGTSAPAFGVLGVAGGGTGSTSATFVNLSSNVTGTLAVSNGGTGITSFGSNVATFLGTPSSANFANVITNESGSGNVVFSTTPTLTNPTVTNYTETGYSANTSTAITIDLANGTVQNLTLTGTATITMPSVGLGKSFILFLRTGAGGYTVTWSTVKWPAGTAPTITSTASRLDIYSFFSDGTNWYGASVSQNYTP